MKHGKTLLLTALLFLPSLGTANAKGESSPDEQGAQPPPALTVSATWLQDNLDTPNLLILDARSAEAYAAGHLPGAVHFSRPAGQDGVKTLQQQLGEQGLSGAERLVLYGDEVSYESVGWLFWLLEWAGSGPVQVLDGGFQGWMTAGGAVETTPRSLPAVTFVGQADEAAVISPAEILAELGERSLEILDLRDGVDWRGTGYEAPPSYTAGHIPHSLPHDFRALITDPSQWPRADALRADLERVGPRRGTHVWLTSTFALYGVDRDDYRPGLGYFLLRLAGVPARVLIGGWEAWTAAPVSPVVRIIDAAALATLLERHNPDLASDQLPPDMMLFDNRGDHAFDADHIPGAFSLAAEDFLDDFEAVAQQYWSEADPAHIPVAFYCYGRDCVRSRYCSTKAARAGFQNLLWFRDGFPAWLSARLPRHSGTSAQATTATEATTKTTARHR